MRNCSRSGWVRPGKWALRAAVMLLPPERVSLDVELSHAYEH